MSDKPREEKERLLRDLFERIEARLEDSDDEDDYDSLKVSKLCDLFRTHSFWNTQPVMNYLDTAPRNSFLQPIKQQEASDISVDVLPLPNEYRWETIDLHHGKTMREVYQLLADNYVEDDSGTFRFEYQIDFLRWCLEPPGYNVNLNIAIRS